MSSIIYVTVTATGGQGATGVGVPTGGTINQAIVKNSATNYDTSWKTLVPNGGTTGQVLTKSSNLNLATTWSAIPNQFPESCLLLTGINYFGVRVNTLLTTSYPQLIPMTKISGGLSIASDLITLTKGYVYEVVLQLSVIGTGYSGFRIYTSTNTDLTTRPNIAISANYNSGDSSADGKAVIDLSAAGSDTVIKVVNTFMAGTPTVTASYGSLIIKKYVQKVV